LIDLHCHLIPGLDDGPANMDETLELARTAVAGGTRTIVATPHIDHRWEVAPDQIEPGVAAVRQALDDAGIELEVLAGAEIALSRFVELGAAERNGLRLGNGPYLLLESPHTEASGNFDTFVLRLRDQGDDVLLAHPERCPLFLRRPERLDRLVDAGVLCSITAASMSGRFGNTVRSLTLDLMRRGMVHNVASDSHDAVNRGPDLRTAFVEAERQLPGIGEQAAWLTEEVPAAILAGAELPPRPPLPRARLRDRLSRLLS
jgi:protein-tyrosine phosphatase